MKKGARPLFLSEASSRTGGGFTLIELILVMVMMGILSFVALSFFNRTVFDVRGYADEVSSMLRFAQKEAIAKRRNVCVTVTPANVTLSFGSATGGACDTALPSPDGDASFSKNAPSGVGLTGSGSLIFDAVTGGSFSFDPQGRLWDSAGTLVTTPSLITVTGDLPIVISVEAETGYVH